MSKRMIFHHPLPLSSEAKSASGIRPQRMLGAFKALGYEVDEVIGYGAQRAQRSAEVKRKISRGERYAFVYSENSTMPAPLADPHHLPLRPMLDFNFFSFCKGRGVPLGIFYRDIYWMFPEYHERVPALKAKLADVFYRYELKKYRALADKLYLPSLQMAKYIGAISEERIGALPPGHDVAVVRRETAAGSGGLKLLYVGGVGAHYGMHELFTGISEVPGVSCTVCTREKDWRLVASEYEPRMSKSVNVVHRYGESLDVLYSETDITVLFVEPQEYREFAAPFKLYEYLGHGKPIIASEGTLSGEFVRSTDSGWTLPYSGKALAGLLRFLLANPEQIEAKRANAVRTAKRNTWEERARTVARDLAGRE